MDASTTPAQEATGEFLLNDSCADRDSFGVFQRHVDSLGSLLMSTHLRAPFVLGVYGPWGTGKSTFMHLLEKRIGQISEEEAHFIRFLPWQFENKDDIFNALMTSVLNELDRLLSDPRVQSRDMASKTRQTLLQMGKKLAFMAVDAKLKQWTGGHADLQEFVDVYQEQSVERTKFINHFQRDFRDAVEEIFKARGEPGGRLFITIDDLDRCTPENAITVLETMKLFFDTDHCYFIVGIDKEVIQRGIEIKYNRHDMIRGQDYLDKLIQLPFTLPPIPTRALERYAVEFLQSHRFRRSAPPILAIAAERNPRRLKRLLNCILLIGQVVAGDGDTVVYEDPDSSEAMTLMPEKLVLLLALQVRFPSIHGLVTAAVEAGHGLLISNRSDEWREQVSTKQEKTSSDPNEIRLGDSWFADIDLFRSEGVAAKIPRHVKELLVSGEHLIGRGAAIENLSGYVRLLQAIRGAEGDNGAPMNIWFDDEADLQRHMRASGILQQEEVDFTATVNRAGQIVDEQSDLPPPDDDTAADTGGTDEGSVEDIPAVSPAPAPIQAAAATATETLVGGGELDPALVEQSKALIDQTQALRARWFDLVASVKRAVFPPAPHHQVELEALMSEGRDLAALYETAFVAAPSMVRSLRRHQVMAKNMTARRFFGAVRAPSILWPGWSAAAIPLVLCGAIALSRAIAPLTSEPEPYALTTIIGDIQIMGLSSLGILTVFGALRFLALLRFRQDNMPGGPQQPAGGDSGPQTSV